MLGQTTNQTAAIYIENGTIHLMVQGGEGNLRDFPVQPGSKQSRRRVSGGFRPAHALNRRPTPSNTTLVIQNSKKTPVNWDDYGGNRDNTVKVNNARLTSSMCSRLETHPALRVVQESSTLMMHHYGQRQGRHHHRSRPRL
jgi:hypothetical protein